MTRPSRYTFYVALGAAWVAAVAWGMGSLRDYERTPGAAALPPPHLPTPSGHVVATERAALPQLVVLVHPHCPCSRATIEELAKLMTECRDRLDARVLVLRPAKAAQGWEQTDLWDSARAIPGVTVAADENGEAARRFGALTSGQVVLYSASGELLFAGGITQSRGHSGDNAGRAAIAALVLNQQAPATTSAASLPHTPVFGCPLFDEPSPCVKDGVTSCRK